MEYRQNRKKHEPMSGWVIKRVWSGDRIKLCVEQPIAIYAGTIWTLLDHYSCKTWDLNVVYKEWINLWQLVMFIWCPYVIVPVWQQLILDYRFAYNTLPLWAPYNVAFVGWGWIWGVTSISGLKSCVHTIQEDNSQYTLIIRFPIWHDNFLFDSEPCM